jgi:hypothetical protein
MESHLNCSRCDALAAELSAAKTAHDKAVTDWDSEACAHIARVAALEAALRQYWDAKTPAAMGAADAVAAKLLTPSETKVDDCSCEGIDSDTGLHTANCVSNQKPECICPKCGLRHGGSSLDGGF